jgi:hypothetical protein
LHFTQANAQSKNCKRASTSPTREKLFFKISFPSKIFKTATAQPTHKDQNTNWTMTAKLLSDLNFTTRQTERQLVTAVLRNGGFSGKLKCSFSNQHLWWVDSEVLPCLPAGREIRHYAKPPTVCDLNQLLMKQVIECYLTDGRN